MLSKFIADMISKREERIASEGVQVTDSFPPGYVIPGEPVYHLPPEELQPEISIRADLLAESRDWSHTNLAIPSLFDRGFRGAGVLVCICDTGVDYTHPDLKDRVRLELCRDFTGSPAGYADRQGHGTHCSGIVAASSNGAGIIGIAPEATLMMAKVLGDSGSGASSWIARGIRHGADSGADIISLSLGGPSPDPDTRAAVQYATGKGCWVVIAAGNDGGPSQSYPGHYPESIAVAATDQNDQRASFSTINRENDIAAPGVQIMSTLPNARYGSMSGTSMATPAVAGCLAIIRSALKKTGQRMPTQAEILREFARTAKDIPPVGVDAETGAGLIDTNALLIRLLSPSPSPSPTPAPVPDPNPTPAPNPPDNGGSPDTGKPFRVVLDIDPKSRRVNQVG